MNFSGIYKNVLVPQLNRQSLLGDLFAINSNVARGSSQFFFPSSSTVEIGPAPMPPCRPCRSRPCPSAWKRRPRPLLTCSPHPPLSISPENSGSTPTLSSPRCPTRCRRRRHRFAVIGASPGQADAPNSSASTSSPFPPAESSRKVSNRRQHPWLRPLLRHRVEHAAVV